MQPAWSKAEWGIAVAMEAPDFADAPSGLRLLTVSRHIPADLSVPIRDLDADFVLAGERTRAGHGRERSRTERAA